MKATVEIPRGKKMRDEPNYLALHGEKYSFH